MNERSFMDRLLQPSKSEMTALRLLDCAYRQFSTNGYAGTSMRTIADETGLALGSIYNHFSSKEEIFTAVITKYHPFIKLFPLFSQIEAHSIDDFLRKCTQLVLDELESHPGFLNLLMIEFIEFKSTHAALLLTRLQPDFAAFGKRFHSYQDHIIEIPTLSLVRIYLSMVIGFIITNVAMKGFISSDDLDISVDHFIETFLHGIVARDLPSSKETL